MDCGAEVSVFRGQKPNRGTLRCFSESSVCPPISCSSGLKLEHHGNQM